MRSENRKLKINKFAGSHLYKVITLVVLAVAMVLLFEIWIYLNPTSDGPLSVTIPQETRQSTTGREWQRLENLMEERFKFLKAGRMFDAIKRASQEFDVPLDLLIGIANAESSLGTSFQFRYDHNCHNWWGIKKLRKDGSYLRCFLSEKAGARTAAKLLRSYYLDEGYTTIEDICRKWIGHGSSEMNCPRWIRNVRQYTYHNE